MNKNIIIIGSIVILLFGGYIVYQKQNISQRNSVDIQSVSTATQSIPNQKQLPVENNKTNNSTDVEKTFTLVQVASHNNDTSCYTIVRGNVYDVTSFISQHPGGSNKIRSLCGIDGTSAFEGQHDGQRHPESELESLFIGTLVK